MEPIAITLRVRGGYARSGDRGMVFRLDEDGTVVSSGLFVATGHADGDNLVVELAGNGGRPCTFRFDLRREQSRPTAWIGATEPVRTS